MSGVRGARAVVYVPADPVAVHIVLVIIGTRVAGIPESVRIGVGLRGVRDAWAVIDIPADTVSILIIVRIEAIKVANISDTIEVAILLLLFAFDIGTGRFKFAVSVSVDIDPVVFPWIDNRGTIVPGILWKHK